MLLKAVDNSDLAFTFCLHRASRSARGERGKDLLMSFLGKHKVLNVHVKF